MSAGRLKYLARGREGAEDAGLPARVRGRRPARDDRGRLEEARRCVAALAGGRRRPRSAHLGPEALGPRRRSGSERSCAGESRRLHSLLRDQRMLAGIGRAWANEILHVARLSPFALSTQLSPEEVERLAAAIDSELARGLELRERGAGDKRVYRVHRRLGEPCPRCGDAARAGRLRRAHGLLLPDVPDRRPDAQGPPALAPAPLSPPVFAKLHAR